MIEEEWSLFDYYEIKDYWVQEPPPHLAMLFLGAAMGVDWAKVRERMSGFSAMPEIAPGPMDGPSIAELAAVINKPPVPRGETLAASVEVLKRLVASPPSAIN